MNSCPAVIGGGSWILTAIGVTSVLGIGVAVSAGGGNCIEGNDGLATADAVARICGVHPSQTEYENGDGDFDHGAVGGDGDFGNAPIQQSNARIDELARKFRDGRTDEKKLRKDPTLSEEDIREIMERAKILKTNKDQHDKRRLMESIKGTEQAHDEALRRLEANPNDPVLQKEYEDARQTRDDVALAKRRSDKERRDRYRDDDK